MTARNKQPTYTTVVNDYLKALGDFATVAGITQGSKVPRRYVLMSLWHLRSHKAVDSVVSEGQLWWFATPEYDNRSRIVAERAPEEKKRNRRKKTIQPKET